VRSVIAEGGPTGGPRERNEHENQEDNIVKNQPLLDLLHAFADEKGATPAQVSLAWMLHKKPFIVPIPGSRKLKRIQENLGAADIDLTEQEFGRIEAELAKIESTATAPTRTSPSSATSTDPTSHQRASLLGGMQTCYESVITPSRHPRSEA
jgi:hypothetical protein